MRTEFFEYKFRRFNQGDVRIGQSSSDVASLEALKRSRLAVNFSHARSLALLKFPGNLTQVCRPSSVPMWKTTMPRGWTEAQVEGRVPIPAILVD